MKKITLLSAFFIGAVSFAQIASTSFEEPEDLSGRYNDLGDASVAHALVNNPGESIVTYASTGSELGFKASYVPYDTPESGLTDGDFVGVTSSAPSTAVAYTDGTKGYRMNDIDGNYILEFDAVDLSGVSSPVISVDFLLSINKDNPANGNYEGDGTQNALGSDRLRIYVRDLTNATELDLFNSTGSDLDELVPFDTASGEYQLTWQTVTENLTTGSNVQLVIEGRTNASAEDFWFDNVVFSGVLGTNDLSQNQFSIYPNPATKGFVNISSKVSGAKNVSVFDVLGKQVINTVLTNDRMDISSLNSGIYIVKIVQGKTSTTKKLVIK